MLIKKNFSTILIFVVSLLLLISFYKFTKNPYLDFSDAAKMAEVGRSIAAGTGYGSRFILNTNNPSPNVYGLFSARVIPPVMPYLNALSFKLFGISDFSVIAVSAFFYLALIIFIFLLAKKIFGDLTGYLAGLGVAANLNLLNYAVSGASETVFTFEIILSILLFTLRKKWTEIGGFIVLALSYFTRPQAPFYILPILIYYIYLKTNDFRKTSRATIVLFVVGCLIIALALFGPSLPILSLLKARIIVSLAQNSTLVPANNVLRMSSKTLSSLLFSNIGVIFKKLFYNLYNFYKLLPEIASPYAWALFILGIIRWNKGRVENSFKVLTIFLTVVIFLVGAITVPFYRYLHPIIPLVYIIAVSFLVWIVEEIFTNFKRKFTWMEKKHLVIGISTALVLFFFVGQTLGIIFLDSRFEAKMVNKDKPPIYVVFSQILKENTSLSDIVVTNLDTWGSWYGDRRTIWYPLSPNQLESMGTNKFSLDAIYLTSYLIDDENNYMGEAWRNIFYNPQDIKDEYIAKNYKLKGIYDVKAEDTYEMESGRAILLVKTK